jgi:hypothetical protein
MFDLCLDFRQPHDGIKHLNGSSVLPKRHTKIINQHYSQILAGRITQLRSSPSSSKKDVDSSAGRHIHGPGAAIQPFSIGITLITSITVIAALRRNRMEACLHTIMGASMVLLCVGTSAAAYARLLMRILMDDGVSTEEGSRILRKL